ncbi:chloramphenicol acetyltransferase (CAT-III) [Flavobacterium limnosediminis JC2902]|uniref:Chloramphenicol acetyltransferase (CAT-III) n=1 Tax=Flavobacterium limnosediminis JC2902 TaxID=1341181 RepID=V6SUM3_9FLAO|nr:chloramphenicol acetyltransferase (CAT-III) [Flavobacterium limnosediminis JC2902]
MLAINAIENFRYRIVDNEVIVFDTINASTTILRDDTTFGFSLIDHFEDLHLFNEKALLEIERVRNTDGLLTRDFSGQYNLIHFSSLPWVNFTSISHSRNFSYPDSCPKISFGKMTEENGKKTMPVSVHVHHALMDGYHVGLFVEELQKQMNS